MEKRLKVYGLPKSGDGFAFILAPVHQKPTAGYNAKVLEVLQENGFQVLDADDPELLELKDTEGKWVLRACWSSIPSWEATQPAVEEQGYWEVEIYCEPHFEEELLKRLSRMNRNVMDRLGITPVNPNYGKFL
jgi:hypothetical protein